MKPSPALIVTALFALAVAALVQTGVLRDAAASISPPASLTETSERAKLGERISIQAAGRGNPWINLSDGRDLEAGFVGPIELVQALRHNKAQPRALASADLNEDGVPDLISGYGGEGGGIITVHKGNIDSIYPNSFEASARRREGGHTDAPFLSPGLVFAAPQDADFIAAGDFDGDGHRDVVTAAKGGDRLYLLSGDGRGRLSEPQATELPGAITAMAAGEINRRDGLDDIAVAVESSGTAKLLVFEGPKGALRAGFEVFTLPDIAGSLAMGQLDDDYAMDLAVAAGNELMIISGRDRKLSLGETERAKVSAPEIDRVAFSSKLKSFAIGDFGGDHKKDIALLSEDGTLRLCSRTKAGWKSRVLKEGVLSETVQLIAARVSSTPVDNLVALDSMNRQLRIVTADNTKTTSKTRQRPARVTATLEVDDGPVAALPMRLNGDAISDLVILRDGRIGPALLLSQPVSTFTVTNTLGFGAGSLFEAILDANETPGTDLIAFNIPGPGPYEIDQTLELPTLTEPATIDGTTQPGFAGAPVVIVKNSGTANGIIVSAGNSAVRGLVINGSGVEGNAGVRLTTNGGNIVEGNFIGIDVSGSLPRGHSFGMRIIESPDNTVGGTAFAARNIVSGNTHGINIEGNDATGNLVQGNIIGPRPDGMEGFTTIQNNGVTLSSTSNNTIGGTAAGARNVISVNVMSGVFITGFGTTGNLVQGNLIGTDATGTADLGNRDGIFIGIGVSNTIGGTTPAARNVISGNGVDGVFIAGTGNLVQGNYIGTDVTGTAAIKNDENGVTLSFINGLTSGNMIGGTTAGARNIISGNGLSGVIIEDPASTANLVQGNFIGTDATGTAPLGNGLNGVTTVQSPDNTIGGSTTDARNIISANGRHGVSIGLNTQGGATGITVQNNFIGTAVDGLSCLGNARDGIFINSDSVTHFILDNIIACNARNGVNVPNFASANPGIEISILHNSIHSNSSLGIDIGDAGLTPNDDADPDIGANTLQNFPSLTSVSFSNGSLHITGNLNSTPNTDFFVQFFSSSECSGSNPGQNQQVINFIPLLFHTDASGNAPIDVSFMITPVGGWMNAVATDPAGNSSEFSTCTPINGTCNFLVSPTSHHVSSAGASASSSVVTEAGCNWTASSNDLWIEITSGSNGSGNGTVEFSLSANTGPVRVGTLTIAGQSVAVTQASGCSFALMPTSQEIGSAGGSGQFEITTEQGCNWTAISNEAWIVITSGHSGTGNGTVFYTVAANSGSQRTGEITVSGQTFTVNQGSGCEFTIDRSSQSFAASAGAGLINITAAAGCDWTAVSNASWIEITSGDSGSGNGTVSYTVEANAGPAIRSDTIMVAGHSYTVFQGIQFNDVGVGHLFYTEIGRLSARGVTLGCGGGNYCPDQAVTRDQMAAFIIRALGVPNPPPPAMQRFLDVPPSNPFYAFIEEMAVRQITLGCGGGNYCPSQPVLREQMAAFIIRGIGEFNPPEPAQQRFLDVPPTNTFYAFIDRMAVLQITLGCGGGNYCPSESVTRAQMAAFLVRAFNL